MFRISFPSGDPLRAAFAALFFMALAFPLFYFTFHGVSLAHWGEEAVGYRYFYSLRAAFGHEYPWLPQGQLPNLYYVLLQHALGFAGYPDNQIFPRIDVFIFWGALAPRLLATLAYWQFCGIVRHSLARAAVLTLFAMVLYGQPHLLGAMAITEYLAWEFPIAIATCSWILSTALSPDGARPPTTQQVLLFGVFCGACAGVKATLLIFPLGVGCVFAAINPRPRVLLGSALLAGGTFLLVWFAILLLSSGGSLQQLRGSIEGFMKFAHSQRQTLDLAAAHSSWLLDFRPRFALDIIPLVILTPLVLFILSMLSTPLRFLIALVPASLLSIGIYALRPHSNTMTETMLFGAACWVVIVAATIKILPPRQSATIHRSATIPVSVAILATFFVYASKGYATLENVQGQSRVLMDAYDKVNKVLDAYPGRTALFATANRYRIRSIEGGMCKGGADILDMQWYQQRYVARLFPQLICYYFVKQPVDAGTFEKAVLMSADPAETAEQALQRVETFFSISLTGFQCNTSVPAYAGVSYRICLKDERRDGGLQRSGSTGVSAWIGPGSGLGDCVGARNWVAQGIEV